MATNFPTSLDDFANYVDGTTIMEAATLNDMQFAIEALEAKVGKDSSAVISSHDYKLANLMTPVTYAGEESVTLPNGMIIKTGRMSGLSGTASGTVTFDTAFPTGVKSVVFGSLDTVAFSGQLVYKTLSVNNFAWAKASTLNGFSWLVIGH